MCIYLLEVLVMGCSCYGVSGRAVPSYLVLTIGLYYVIIPTRIRYAYCSPWRVSRFLSTHYTYTCTSSIRVAFSIYSLTSSSHYCRCALLTPSLCDRQLTRLTRRQVVCSAWALQTATIVPQSSDAEGNPSTRQVSVVTLSQKLTNWQVYLSAARKF